MRRVSKAWIWLWWGWPRYALRWLPLWHTLFWGEQHLPLYTSLLVIKRPCLIGGWESLLTVVTIVNFQSCVVWIVKSWWHIDNSKRIWQPLSTCATVQTETRFALWWPFSKAVWHFCAHVLQSWVIHLKIFEVYESSFKTTVLAWCHFGFCCNYLEALLKNWNLSRRMLNFL